MCIVFFCAVKRGADVPWGEIDAQLQTGCLACRSHLRHNVSFAILPWTGLYGIFRVFCGPEAESVVVLRHDDHQFRAGQFCRPGPLVRIEFNGIEEGGILIFQSPLAVGEGVEPEVQKTGDLQILPGDLPLGRFDPCRLCGDGFRGVGVCDGGEGVELVLINLRKYLDGEEYPKQNDARPASVYYDPGFVHCLLLIANSPHPLPPLLKERGY